MMMDAIHAEIAEEEEEEELLLSFAMIRLVMRWWRSPVTPPLSLRFLSSDASWTVKPGEIGEVSGIPEKHLKRQVCLFRLSL